MDYWVSENAKTAQFRPPRPTRVPDFGKKSENVV
jgi:hypothetical protein